MRWAMVGVLTQMEPVAACTCARGCTCNSTYSHRRRRPPPLKLAALVVEYPEPSPVPEGQILGYSCSTGQPACFLSRRASPRAVRHCRRRPRAVGTRRHLYLCLCLFLQLYLYSLLGQLVLFFFSQKSRSNGFRLRFYTDPGIGAIATE